MAWTAPMTAVVNEVWTSAQWNTFVRDNLEETAPAKATTAGRWIVSDEENSVVEREITSDVSTGGDTTSSSSYTTLSGGPSVTVTTGKRALVWINCELTNSIAGAESYASVAVSGSSSIDASDTWGLNMGGHSSDDQWMRVGVCWLFEDLTAGSNTFTMEFRAPVGTGRFRNRELIVAAQ